MASIDRMHQTPFLRRELAAAFALLGFSATPCLANNLPVGNCLDDGSGASLRSVVASAADNDTVDLS